MKTDRFLSEMEERLKEETRATKRLTKIGAYNLALRASTKAEILRQVIERYKQLR